MVSSGPTASPQFRTRTDVLFASRAPIAVILRRGPRIHWQLILWDTRRDTFTAGQWMKGFVKLMDLSPRGDKLIYWAAQYHGSARWHRPWTGTRIGAGLYDPLAAGARMLCRRQKRYPRRKLPRYLAGTSAGMSSSNSAPREVQGVWTAVSTPPYFSALAIWPSMGHWTGGGFFASDNRIVLFEPRDGLTPIENTPVPSTVTVASWFDPVQALPPPVTLAAAPLRQPSEQQRTIEVALRDGGARFIDWTFVMNGDVLFACDGGIYRHAGVPAPITPDILRNARRLIDLAPARFELIRAPGSAMRW